MFLDAAVFRCLETKINIYFYYRRGVNGFKTTKNTATCFLVFIYDTIKKNVAKKIGWKYTKTSKNCLNLGSVVN